VSRTSTAAADAIPAQQLEWHGVPRRLLARLRLVVEIDGIHHLKVPAVVSDALRQNDLSLASDTALRLPLLGLRVAPDEFMRQVREGLVSGGWRAGSVAS
jgi:hypothetical protein